jgi:hypothetical protein
MPAKKTKRAPYGSVKAAREALAANNAAAVALNAGMIAAAAAPKHDFTLVIDDIGRRMTDVEHHIKTAMSNLDDTKNTIERLTTRRTALQAAAELLKANSAK